MTNTPDDEPDPQISFEAAEEIKALSRIVGDLHRQMNPSPRLGVATEHSIEDPFTGEITVTVRLDR